MRSSVGRTGWRTGAIRAVLFASIGAFALGCTRTAYRLQADRQVALLLREKAADSPWRVPESYSIWPDPRSRFADPSPPDDPALPIPAPRLYSYELPDLKPQGRAALPPRAEAVEAGQAGQEQIRAARASPSSASSFDPYPSAQQRAGDVPAGAELRVAPLPQVTWHTLPASCLRRMVEFSSVRSEYARTFGEPPQVVDDAPRLDFESIMALARINSREYQTQKENLYRAALALTLERFDYELKFSPFSNRASPTFLHDRSGGTTVNNLLVPSTLAVEKTLITGGDLVARFANSVILTFNGPTGFAADIGSELLLDLSQAILQRDIQFESLTQAERNVVYAARDYARFRKVFYRNLANQYYSLLLSYRAIEIGSQDYFSTSRAFYQGEAEYRASRLPRVQVDQLEQNMLSSRSRLIATCNALESDLDSLKLALGLPTELPLNLDLSELEELTLRDEVAVLAERVRRARRNIEREQSSAAPDAAVMLNATVDLAGRMLALGEAVSRLADRPAFMVDLERRQKYLAVIEGQYLVELNQQALREARRSEPPAPPLRILQRLLDLIDSLQLLAQRSVDWAAQTVEPSATIQETLAQLHKQREALRDELDQIAVARQVERIPELVEKADQLAQQYQSLVRQITETFRLEIPAGAERDKRIFQEAEMLAKLSQQLLEQYAVGLPSIEIDHDLALLTALTQRLDLMNNRGQVADAWRRIKLAGDDLRSILDLRATQSIRTRSDVNRPLDFTWDESTTRVGAVFDTPLNRRAQRNAFRNALIDYQRAVRNLMAAEDSIKFAVREDLRQLALNREQYTIAVASAALAFERVISTRLQLQLGIQNVAARDFLEAQQAYTSSLNSVADVHLRYLRNRIQLFLDLELLELTDEDLWPALRDETVVPQPKLLWPPAHEPPYGELPPVLYSRRVRRHYAVPDGVPAIEHTAAPAEAVPAPEPQTQPDSIPRQVP